MRTIICSNGEDLFDSPRTKTLLTREYKIYKYFAAAIRRIFIPDIINLPDYEWHSWGKHALKTILNLLNKEQFDYIHSISFPCASHQVALEIKQKTGLPWIAQFYDPWYDNPYRIFKTKYLKKKIWKWNKMLSKMLISSSTLIMLLQICGKSVMARD
jgi:hypothetical protein